MAEELENRARTVSADQLPDFLAELRKAEAIAFARLLEPQPVASRNFDELITVAEAARKTAMSAKFIYSHAEGLPFTRRIGRSVRCSRNELERYMKRLGK